MGAIWSSANGWLGRRAPGPMPQFEDGVRYGFKVLRFPDFWPFLGGQAYPTGFMACASSPGGGWSLGAL